MPQKGISASIGHARLCFSDDFKAYGTDVRYARKGRMLRSRTQTADGNAAGQKVQPGMKTRLRCCINTSAIELTVSSARAHQQYGKARAGNPEEATAAALMLCQTSTHTNAAMLTPGTEAFDQYGKSVCTLVTSCIWACISLGLAFTVCVVMKKDQQQTGQQKSAQAAPSKAKAPASDPSTGLKGGVEKKKVKQSPAAKVVANGGAAAKAASEIDDIFGQAAAKSKQQKEQKPAAASKEAEPCKVGFSPICLPALSMLVWVIQTPVKTLCSCISALQKPSKVEGSKDDIFGEQVGKGRKKTEEGFNIYTEDELGLNRPNAGMTDLCPFDCDCCF
jgi:hypothetical protein